MKIVERESKQHERLRREVSALYSLDHPHIIRLFFNFSDEEVFYLGMEFAAGGSLYDRLVQLNGPLELAFAARVFAEVCDGVGHLHSRKPKLVHRDLRPENVFLDDRGQAKLGDFGWVAALEAGCTSSSLCGTLEYAAPECFHDPRSYDER